MQEVSEEPTVRPVAIRVQARSTATATVTRRRGPRYNRCVSAGRDPSVRALRSSSGWSAALVWLLAAQTPGCKPKPEAGGHAGKPDPRPSFVLVSIDTLRADHLGVYGYPRDISPTIDRLTGTRFALTVSTSSWTLPTHVSMLTGLYPSVHGVEDDGVRLAESVPTLAGALRAAGYRTLAVTSHVYASSQFGLDRGFDVFDDELTRGGTRSPVAAEVVDRITKHLPKSKDRPFFAFFHFFDPHWPYAPPEPFRSRFADPGYRGPMDGTLAPLKPYFMGEPMPAADLQHIVDLYDGEIAYVDSQLARLLGELKKRNLLDNTVFIVTADHGEEFKEHGSLGHARTLYQEQLAVPLIFSGHPSMPPNTTRSDPASLVDIAPTVLAMAGVEQVPAMDGRSLVPAGKERALHAQSRRFGVELRAALHGRAKVIENVFERTRVFYDLVSDPGEQKPLKSDPTGGPLRRGLHRFVRETDSGWHLTLKSPEKGAMRVSLTAQTDGRIILARRFFSDNLGGSRAEFEKFELADDRRRLVAELVLTNHMGEIILRTDPPTSELRLDVRFDEAQARVFLGGGTEAPGKLALRPEDPRLVNWPRLSGGKPGLHVRSHLDPSLVAPRSNLSEQTRAQLEALGYVE